jgi:heme oxygenase
MTILRDITNDKHREVESLPLVQALLHGEMTEREYLGYLYELHLIYETLESLVMAKGMIRDLEGLQRADAILEDIKELDPNEEYRHDYCQSTEIYLDYLIDLFHINSEMLFAHVYTRHMGDLYGGKILARKVPGSGKAYQFDDRPGLIKKFNEKITLEMGGEANRAFDYFIKIFSELWPKIHK